MTMFGKIMVGMGLDYKEFIKGLNDAQNKINKFASMMKTALGGIAAGFTVAQVVRGINESVAAFRTQERAIASLNTALQNSGTYTAEYSQHLQQLAGEIQKTSNYGDEMTEQALALGQSFAGNIKLTDDLIKATVDYAAATGQDLNTAFTMVGKSIGTNTNALARYGVTLDEGMTKEQKMAKITQVLAQRFEGSAKDMADSSVQLKNAVGDLAESFGALLNPSLEKAQNYLIKTTNAVTDFINHIRIARTEVNNLKTVEEAQYKLHQNWVEQDKLQKKINDGIVMGVQFRNTKEWDAKLKKYKEEETAIRGQIKAIIAKNKVEEENSKKKYVPTTETTQKTTKTKSTSSGSSSSPAIDEYKAFVEQYKQVTRDYEATLQARNYVEKTLGISASSEDYQSALGVYKDYFLKRKEIELSNAKDKASLLKMEETKLQQDLQLIALQKTDGTQRKQWELIKGYQQQMADMQLNEQAYQNAGGFFASFGASFNEKLAIEKNYLAERAKIEQMSFTSLQEQQDAYNQLELLKTSQYNQLKVDNWRKMGTDIEGILENSFSNMLTNYGNFSDNMKQLALNLIQYITKQLIQLMVTSKAVESMLTSLGGGFGKVGGFIKGFFGKNHSGHTVIKRHSGGLEMPDQTEHFALLKNNERVLSPSETSAYNQGMGNTQGGGYVVYAPQVKAMDSKDVAQWFNENKNQVIAIISDGIKNNKQGLRTQIQGV